MRTIRAQALRRGEPPDPPVLPRAWAAPVNDVVTRFGSDVRFGLTTEEAASRLQRDGPNQVSGRRERTLLANVLSQFTDTLILVLLAAAAATGATGDAKDASFILAVVVINAAISSTQDYRAERAIAALQSMTAPRARVRRQGVEEDLPAADVVTGDIVELHAGDVVPADVRLIHAPDLHVDESALTGESAPVDKQAAALDDVTPLADQRNMAFLGTAVTAGRASAVVVATGARTALGRVAELVASDRAPATPLQRQLSHLGRVLALGIVVVSAIVTVVGVVDGESVGRMALVGVSLAVAAIPESLPAVVTLSLAIGAHRMARRNAIVRSLPAVETLGSVTVIATDKTGTLTTGDLTVEKIWTVDGESTVDALRGQVGPSSPTWHLLVAAASANDAVLKRGRPGQVVPEFLGDPTDGALLLTATALVPGIDRNLGSRVAEIPFDSQRKRMTTVHRCPDGAMVAATKGAAECVLDICTTVLHGDGTYLPCQGEVLDRVVDRAEALARSGYRVLAVAGKEMGSSPHRIELDHIESGFALYGLVAMIDPPRPGASTAVARARRAGILPVMITGDHPATARAVADRLGILADGKVVTGSDLEQMPPDDLVEQVRRTTVYARTTPEQKLAIIEAWSRRGDVVAMTGDGVNDAPALRRADVGVAMGCCGTDVAKGAADIVLADDDFTSIVGAVAEGRRVYDNIRRFIQYGLIGGLAEIVVMLFAPFFGLPLALLPAQILWINLLTHGLPGLALGVEAADARAMERPPRAPSESILSGLVANIVIMGFVTGGMSLAVGVWGYHSGAAWQTMIFVTLSLLQLGNALALRSTSDSSFSLGLTSNHFLTAAVLGTIAAQLLVLAWPPARQLFDLRTVTPWELGALLAISTVGFWVIEARKAVVRRKRGAMAVPIAGAAGVPGH